MSEYDERKDQEYIGVLEDGYRVAHEVLDTFGVKREDVKWNGPVQRVTEYPVCDRIKFLGNEAIRLIKALVNEDDCWFDHHGCCQAHGLEEDCSHARAKKFLAMCIGD